MKQLLKNARIYDGTGSAPYTADILLDGDRIARIAAGIDESADRVIDLEGKSVSSGFIDGHSHNDWFAIKKEPLPYFLPFLRQGITTFVTGNCGISEIGFGKGNPYTDKLGGGIFSFENTTGQYGTVEEFFRATDRQMPCNIAVLAGHCSARAAAGGIENRPLTEAEETRMLEILETALQQGAAGISLGLMYQPGLYADVAELKKVAALCVREPEAAVFPRDLRRAPHAEGQGRADADLRPPAVGGRGHHVRYLQRMPRRVGHYGDPAPVVPGHDRR